MYVSGRDLYNFDRGPSIQFLKPVDYITKIFLTTDWSIGML